MTTQAPNQLHGAISRLPILGPVFRLFAPGSGRCTKMQLGYAANTAPETDVSLVAASNEMRVTAAAEDAEARLFIPFGEYPVRVRDRKTKRSVDVLQVFNEESAEAVVAGLKGLRGAVSRLFGRAPVYIGHPDVPELASLYNDTRSYGVVTGANVAEHDGRRGVVFEVAWNRLGRELIGSDAYMYHSPHWPLERVGVLNGLLRMRPVGLRSIGLTNEPNIADAEIFGANVAGPDLDAAANGVEGLRPDDAGRLPLVSRLIALIGDAEVTDADTVVERVTQLIEAARKSRALCRARWDAEQSAYKAGSNVNTGPGGGANVGSDDELLTAIFETSDAATAALNESLAASAASLAAANADKERLTAELAAASTAASERDAAAKALVTLAVEAGRLPGGRAEETLAAFNTDFNAALETVANARAIIPLGSATASLSARSRAPRHASAEFLGAVNSMMDERGCSYMTAWAAVKAARPELYGLM